MHTRRRVGVIIFVALVLGVGIGVVALLSAWHHDDDSDGPKPIRRVAGLGFDAVPSPTPEPPPSTAHADDPATTTADNPPRHSAESADSTAPTHADNGSTAPPGTHSSTDAEPTPPPAPATTAGIRGTVVDSAEAPLAGVGVTATPIWTRPGMPVEQMDFPDLDSRFGPRSDDRRPTTFTTTTDAAGAFEFRGLDPAHRYRVTVAETDAHLGASRLAPAFPSAEAELHAARWIDVGAIVLYRFGRIVGVVRDSAGNPVADAVVRLGEPQPDDMTIRQAASADGRRVMVFRTESSSANTDTGNGNGTTPDGAAKPSLPPLPPGATYSGADGQFVLDRVPAKPHTISARHRDFRDAQQSGIIVEQGQTAGPVTLTLGPLVALRVFVVDHTSAPIAGAEVWAGHFRYELMRFSSRRPSPPPIVTDANGEAELAGLQSLSLTLQITAPGFALYRDDIELSADRPNELRVVMQAAGQIVGRVVEPTHRRGIGGARLTIWKIDDNRVEAMLDYMHGMLPITQPDGSFSFSNVVPGVYRIDVTADGFAPAQIGPVLVRAGQTADVGDQVMAIAGRIAVTVVDVEGGPVEGAIVALEQGPEMHVILREIEADGEFVFDTFPHTRLVTDANGRAEIRNVPLGEAVVSAKKPGFADGFGHVLKVVSGETVPLQIRLVAGGFVRGTAVRADESPWAGGHVYLFRHGLRSPMEMVVADAAGQFAFPPVVPGRYRLATQRLMRSPDVDASDADAPFAADWFDLAAGETVTKTVVEPPQSVLLGTLRHADGAPAAHHAVSIGWIGGSGDASPRLGFEIGTGVTDANGQFRFAGLPIITDEVPRGFAVQAIDAATNRAYLFALTDTHRGEWTMTFWLPNTAQMATLRIGPVVDDATLAPVVGAGVTLERMGMGESNGPASLAGHPIVRLRASTDPAGTATVADLLPGTYRVTILHPTFAAEIFTTSIASAGGTEFVTDEIRLLPGGTLQLHVSTLQPVLSGEQWATVDYHPVGRPEAARTASVRVGDSVVLQHLALGVAYEFHISASGHQPITRIATITAGCALAVTLTD